MVIATPEPKKVLEAAEAQGVVAKEIGRVTEKPGIRVRNKGVRQDSPWLDFAPHNS
jgi:selenophosphate synthetase-related protein